MKKIIKGSKYKFKIIYKEVNKNKLDEDRSHGEWENAEE